MFNYSHKAITFKTIPKFSYELYTNISINMLKYNNDSSAVLRVLDAFNSATREVVDDIPYSIINGIGGINFKQIDRLNKFYLDNIVNLDLEKISDNITCYDDLVGYSKYTDQQYTLEYIDSSDNFIRHSYPCDCFIAHKVEKGNPQFFSLSPNIWNNVDLRINSSAVTIKPVGAMDETTKGVDKYITVKIEGINIRNELVEEDININLWTEYVTEEEFIIITKIKVLNSYIAYDIMLYPYVNGREVLWSSIVSDREELDRRNALVSFNIQTKQMEYSAIYEESVSFPLPTDIVKTVGITGIEDNDTITDYYIDQVSGLFYVITSNSKLLCYPFIIPKAVNPEMDEMKTINQACRIDYFDDAINKKYTFDIFPTSKANDIDTLDIYINGELYQDGMIIDLFRQKLLDNRLDIPYDILFKRQDDALIEFRTYGYEDSSFAVYLIKSQVDPLYIKDLTTVYAYNDSFEDSSFIEPSDKSTSIDYPESQVTSGLVLNVNSNIYRLSKYGNLVVDGYLITDIFKTFYYSEADNSIITSDTITHLTGITPDGDNTINIDTEAGEATAGMVSAGGIYDSYRYAR